MFLLNQAFDEGVLDADGLHTEDNNNTSSFPCWKYARFDLELLDKEESLPDFFFIKNEIIGMCHVLLFIYTMGKNQIFMLLYHLRCCASYLGS